MIDHELRRRTITSTDVGPIFGVDLFRTAFDVWCEKHGHAPPFQPSRRMLMGKDLEQGIVQAYSRITGLRTHWTDKTLRHPTREWMAGSPDAFAGDWKPLGTAFGYARGVDAKLVFYDQRRKWGWDANSIPEGYQLQAWWLMATTEADRWDIAAWLGEDEPRIYEIERDREAERVVIAKCEGWHRRYVLGDEVPPISGSKAAEVWLQQAFPTHARPDMRDATEEEAKLLDQYAGWRVARTVSTERCKEMENQIKLAIKDREGLEWDGGSFTWRKTKDGVEIHWEAIARGLLNEKDKETQATLLDLHTTPKPGERRMRFVSRVGEIAEVA